MLTCKIEDAIRKAVNNPEGAVEALNTVFEDFNKSANGVLAGVSDSYDAGYYFDNQLCRKLGGIFHALRMLQTAGADRVNKKEWRENRPSLLSDRDIEDRDACYNELPAAVGLRARALNEALFEGIRAMRDALQGTLEMPQGAAGGTDKAGAEEAAKNEAVEA